MHCLVTELAQVAECRLQGSQKVCRASLHSCNTGLLV